jgi:ribosomal protein S18 acetylase RimI-like enzyme
MATDYVIRPMAPGEMELATEWAAAEGWNPGLHDGPVFYSTDPNGFMIGLLGGEPVACISTVAYDETFGFLGFYIVRPEFRGKGFGLQVWKKGMEYLGGRNVGLDGVPDQIENYRKSGFTLAYRNIRYQGRARGEVADRGPEIRAVRTTDFDRIAGLDRAVFPAARDGFLRQWLTLPDSHALAVIEDGDVTGFGVIRACREGHKIGPLVADSERLAEALHQALVARVDPGTAVFLDVPEVNRAAVSMAERRGMTPAFETARMYNRGEPDLRLDKVYGVTTFELG